MLLSMPMQVCLSEHSTHFKLLQYSSLRIVSTLLLLSNLSVSMVPWR